MHSGKKTSCGTAPAASWPMLLALGVANQACAARSVAQLAPRPPLRLGNLSGTGVLHGRLFRRRQHGGQLEREAAALADWLVTRMSPPCSLRIFWLTGRPRPVPRPPLCETKSVKILSMSSGGMPHAVVFDRDPHQADSAGDTRW